MVYGGNDGHQTKRQLLDVARHTKHAPRHTLHVTRHLSRILYANALFTLGNFRLELLLVHVILSCRRISRHCNCTCPALSPSTSLTASFAVLTDPATGVLARALPRCDSAAGAGNILNHREIRL